MNLSLIKLSNLRISNLNSILSNIRDLTILNQGFTFNDPFLQEEALKTNIETFLIEVQRIHSTLLQNSLEISSELHDLNTKNSIRVIFSKLESQYFNLNDATQQIISKTFNIKNKNLSELTASQSDVFFVTSNLFNEYYASLNLASNYYVESLNNRTLNKNNVFSVFLIISLVAIFFSLIISIPALINVNRTKEAVLALFLEIPERTVKILYTKCENFISNLQLGEDDELLSDNEEEIENKFSKKDKREELRFKKRRRKFKHSAQGQKRFFFIMIFGGLILSAYFIFIYVSSYQFITNINALTKEINATNTAESFYSFVNNAERFSSSF